MGMPSLSICVTELFTDYDVQAVVRVGSCGGLAPDLGLHDLILASGAYTDSALNRLRFHGLDYAPSLTSGCFARRTTPPRRCLYGPRSACSSAATPSTTLVPS